MVTDSGTRPLLPISEDWTSTSWETTFEAANRLPLRLKEISLKAIQTIFPPEITESLRAENHPVVSEQLWVRGRFELLELGLAVVSVGVDQNDLCRLRHPDQYQGAASELRAMLLPLRAGARLTRPPVVMGKKLCEYIAEFPSGLRVAVEAKQPNVGERELDRQAVELSVFMELMRQLDWLHRELPSARATLNFTPTDNSPLGGRHGVDAARVRSAVAAAVERVAAAHQGNVLVSQPIELGELGTLVVQPDDELGRLQFDANSPRSVREGFLRIRRSVLNKAAQQIADSGLPGLIILDLERDRAGLSGYDLLVQWARAKSALGAVILIERHMIDGRGCNGAHVVPGPRFDEIAEAISQGLEFCADGHLHYTSLSTLTSPCPARWLPTYPDLVESASQS